MRGIFPSPNELDALRTQQGGVVYKALPSSYSRVLVGVGPGLCELPRIRLLGSRMNKGKKKGRGPLSGPQPP